ncbi:VTC domain-containing protein [Candidatus Pelagibacter sp.]|nr:VTC domain-containing protein [Candidatus Pelagibacter sp.]
MNQSRIEKKFIFPSQESDLVKKILLVNNFKKLYSDRYITSIYIDNLNFDSAKDNINGINERKKLRVRWYNNNFKKIYLEEKNKNNFFVWKNIKKLEMDINKKNLINKIHELLLDNNKYIDSNYNYKLILKINYKRSYFISDQGEFRATIDTQINTSPILDFNKMIGLPETILEFKFSQRSESYFRDFFSLRGLNIRSKKYSKYIQSFIALEESGLIS